MGSMSCARDGIFQLEVVLPGQPPGGTRPFALVEISDVEGFPEQWDDVTFGTSGARSVPVRGTDPVTVPFDVISGDPSTQVSVRVRYCREDGCGSDDNSALDLGSELGFRYTFQRSIWIGRRTRYDLHVPAVEDEPTSRAPELIYRCQVLGCGFDFAPPGTGVCLESLDIDSATARHPCD